MTAFYNWTGIERAQPEFLEALSSEAEKRGWDANDLAGHISTESAFIPSIRAPNGTATGLIQFIDATARSVLGWPARQPGEAYDLASKKVGSMSAMEQLPLIFKFYDRASKGKALSGADFKIIGFGVSPSKPDSFVMGDSNAEKDSHSWKVYHWNSACDVDKNGVLTVGDVRAMWARKRAAAKARGFYSPKDGGSGRGSLPEPSPSSTLERVDLPTLRRGSWGPAVFLLQLLIGGLKTDGRFGSLTAEAVRDFQKKHALSVDGVVGANTWTAATYKGQLS